MDKKLWLNKYEVLDEDDLPGLDASAGIHEFKNMKPRSEAEDEAYKDYKTDKAIQCAAHHYLGVKAAHAAGSIETAKKHGACYINAMKAAGEEPHGPVPDKVKEAADNIAHKAVTFKKHPADKFFSNEDKATTDV